jgi:tetratricopeptide (TPR) repeat protein
LSSFRLSEAYRVFGESQKAKEYYAQAFRGSEKTNYLMGLGFCHCSQGDFALAEARYSSALEHYQDYLQYATQDNHAWGMAKAHAKQALAYAYLDNLEKSRAEVRRTLIDIQDWGEKELRLLTLLAEAVSLVQEGKPEQAIELAALIQNHPVSWNETKQHARQILETASQDLPEKEFQGAIERGKALDLEEIVIEIISSG